MEEKPAPGRIIDPSLSFLSLVLGLCSSFAADSPDSPRPGYSPVLAPRLADEGQARFPFRKKQFGREFADPWEPLPPRPRFQQGPAWGPITKAA